MRMFDFMTPLGLAAALAFAAAPALAQTVTPISQLPQASIPLAGEAVPVVQGGATKQAKAAAFGIPLQGSVAPTPLARWQMWWDTSTSPPALKIFDGASWVPIGSLDTAAHVWTSVTPLSVTVGIVQPSGGTQPASDIASIGAGTGIVHVPSTTGWPSKGYLRTADNGEYIAYQLSATAGGIQVTGRGQCGSGASATTHTNGTSIVWMALILCPAGGTTPPFVAIDGAGNQYIKGVAAVFPTSGLLVGATDAQTLTNKSIAGSEINSGTVPYPQLPVGTSSSMVAAGDDSRITGAAQKAANLSDLADAPTARANIGIASISAADYGVVADGKFVTVAITTHGTNIIDTASGATFTSAMCHSGSGCTGATDQSIFLSNIGTAGANFTTTITQVNSAHQIVVASVPPTTVTGANEEVDWGTDNATAFNNWCAAVRTAAPFASNAGAVRAIIPQGNYYVSAGIECAGLNNGHATRAIIIDGTGAQIIGTAVNGTQIFDLLGSPTVKVKGLAIYGGLSAGNAKYGLVIGRYALSTTTNQGAAGSDDAFQDISIAGWFSGGAPLYNFAAEDVRGQDSQFNNYATTANSYAAIFDGNNHWNITAIDNVTYAQANAVDTPVSFDDDSCDNCRFGAVAASQGAVWIGNARGFTLRGGIIRSTGTTSYGIDLWTSNGNIINPRFDTHMEDTHLAANLRITGSGTGATPTLSGETLFNDSGNEAQTSLFAIDTSHVASVTISSLAVDARGNGNAPVLFDDPTKYTVRRGKAELHNGITFNRPAFYKGDGCDASSGTYVCHPYGGVEALTMVAIPVTNTGIGTSEVNLASVPFPALGKNDAIRITMLAHKTGTTSDTSTFRVRLAAGAASCTPLSTCTQGSGLFAASMSTTSLVTLNNLYVVQNANATNSQILFPGGGIVSFGTSVVVPTTLSVQTNAGGYLNIDCSTDTSSADGCVLDRYLIEILWNTAP